MPESVDQLQFVETHRNHFLFSDYYLDKRVSRRSEWQVADAEARAALQKIAAIWEAFTPQGDSEAQTELEWIRPVLRALGHTFNVQVSVKTSLGTRAPDYVFYPDEVTRQAAKGGVVEERDLRDALAVGDAKAWERPLDQPIRVQQDLTLPKISGNPSFQIDFYIRHTGLPWGILTNGRHWRLYHEDSSKNLDVYYEVDLPALIEQATAPGAPPEHIDAFKYFYLFFRRAAFVGDPPWLDLVLEESRFYEQGVSDDLKEQVYEALGALAQGFLDFPRNELGSAPETLKVVYDNSLIVLYRLLFILYAEDRGLLPVNQNAPYTQQYSLYALKRTVAQDLQRHTPAVASRDVLWHRLRQLWDALNAGDAALGVPAYNGGLFDPEKHPFLERYRVGDSYLRRAIDLLARAEDPATGQRDFVDYRDLEIRHLGSIYEGLLEYQLRYAEEPLVVQRERGREVYVPVDEAEGEPTVQAGQVYLVTDKGERKATGSYYTPDYIVQYIVEHTVGPVLDDVRERYSDDQGNVSDEAGLVREILALNVLDPAMGSGHFLVAATDFIARYLVELGLETAEGLRGEGELAYWRRRVVQACIYGVDVNPLAVELAKLSLWLATVAKDKPLSFLDHHLRPGNSLIGARVGDLLVDGGPRRTRYQERKEREQREAGQLSMLDDSAFVGSMRTATGMMDQIEALESETVDDVREAERIYRDVVRDTTRRYRTLADVWAARHLGLDMDDTVWAGLTQHVLRGGGFEVPQYADIIGEARAVAEARRFFHWELEFPEVFFDAHGRLLEEESGFDSVVGNPPYIRPHKLSSTIKRYFWANLLTFVAKSDIYVCFMEQGIRLLRQNGALGLITSDGWLFLDSFEEIRKFLLDTCWVHSIVDLPDGVFEDATVETVAFVVQKVREDTSTEPLKIQIVRAYTIDAAEKLDGLPGFSLPQNLFKETYKHTFDLSLTPRVSSLKQKIASIGVELGRITTLSFGLKTGDDSVFLRSSKQTGQDRPLLRGANVGRYTYQYEGEFVWYVPEKMREHRITARPGEPERFEDRKILIRDTLEELAGTYDSEGYYVKDVLILRSQNPNYRLKYVLAVLNSALMRWYYETSFPTLHVQRDELASLPIHCIVFTTPPDTREKLMRAGQELYLGYIEGAPVGSVTGFVEEQLAHDPERADVVHDLSAFLAEQMVDLHKRHQRLESALDPFKFLNRGVEFVKLPAAFGEEIKYGQLVREPVELGAVHHDIDGLRLVPAGELWELQVQIKKRDPEAGWQGWQYEEDGHNIARAWVLAYRWELDAEKARYYEHAFQVLDEFANAKSFPGGYTRTTLKKLELTRVPAFDAEANLRPLVELARELADVRERIEQTDELIDQVVYQLYGLTDEEIAVVEGES